MVASAFPVVLAILLLLPSLTVVLPLAFGLSRAWHFAVADVHRTTPKPLWSFFWFRFRKTLVLALLLNLLPAILFSLLAQTRVIVDGKPLPVPWTVAAAQTTLVPAAALAILAPTIAWGLLLLPRINRVATLALMLLPLGVIVPAATIELIKFALPRDFAQVTHRYSEMGGGVAVPLTPHWTALVAALFLAGVLLWCRKRGDEYFG